MSKPIKSTRQARRARYEAVRSMYRSRVEPLPETKYQITYTNGTVESVSAAYMETSKDGTVTFCTGVRKVYYDVEFGPIPGPIYTTVKVVSPNAYRVIDRV